MRKQDNFKSFKALKARDKSPLVIELIYHQLSHTHIGARYHLFIAAGNAILRGTKEYNITDFPSHQALGRDKLSQSCYWTLIFHIPAQMPGKDHPWNFPEFGCFGCPSMLLEQQQKGASRSDVIKLVDVPTTAHCLWLAFLRAWSLIFHVTILAG